LRYNIATADILAADQAQPNALIPGNETTMIGFVARARTSSEPLVRTTLNGQSSANMPTY
jgi:hypothetical protein